MTCTSNNLPPNQFYLLSPGTGSQSTRIVQKISVTSVKAKKWSHGRYCFIIRHFSKTTGLSVQMVDAGGLYTLAETLCQLYRSADARFMTFDLNIIRRSCGR